MLSNLLSGFKKNAPSVQLYGKGLLYKVDIHFDVAISETMNISMEGAVRVGPVSGDVEGQSTYKIASGSPELSSHEIQCRKLKWAESYSKTDDADFQYTHSKKGQKKLKVQEGSLVVEPFLYLIALATGEKQHLESPLEMVLGGKSRKPTILRKEEKHWLRVGDEDIIAWVPKSDGLGIVVPKLKINLSLTTR